MGKTLEHMRIIMSIGPLELLSYKPLLNNRSSEMYFLFMALVTHSLQLMAPSEI